MEQEAAVRAFKNTSRQIVPATQGDPALGPLKLLPGEWNNEPGLPGRGWNMIALPFVSPSGNLNYRLLLNQFNEKLNFFLVDKAVPNRGVSLNGTPANTDQFVVTLDYEQTIKQLAAEDQPGSGLAGGPGLAIHHEPGLWLHMTNEIEQGFNIARLASIPHGDSVLAIGRSDVVDGPPVIPDISGLPVGVSPDLNNNPYLAPYRHFHASPFLNLFDPTQPNDLLKAANAGVNIRRTTVLQVDSTIATGGISNIPFVVEQANAASMKSTFWIQELEDTNEGGDPKLRLQYSQVVMLDFFPRRDGLPGVVEWPHISINTLEKISTRTQMGAAAV